MRNQASSILANPEVIQFTEACETTASYRIIIVITVIKIVIYTSKVTLGSLACFQSFSSYNNPTPSKCKESRL